MSFDLRIINGELIIDASGDLEKVEDNDKLIQDILKMVSTPINGNPFYPWYGCPVTSTLVGNTFDYSMSEAVAQSQLLASLEMLQQLQKIQERSGQIVTPGELLAAIRSVDIQMGYNEPRMYKILIEVLTKALTVTKTGLEVSA